MKFSPSTKNVFIYIWLVVIIFQDIHSKEIGSKDILLDDSPTYNLKKENAQNEKIKEEYEDTEFEIPRRTIFQKKRNLSSMDSNETILKSDVKSPPESGRIKEDSVEVFGGTGNFIGGKAEAGKMFSHSYKKKDFAFSVISAKAKTESFDYFEKRGKWVGDSGKTENQFSFKGFSYLGESLKISYDGFHAGSILSLQDNPYYKKQKRNSSELNVDLEYSQTEKLFHRGGFKLFGLNISDDSRSLPVSFGLGDKDSNVKKKSFDYEVSWDYSENFKIFSIMDYSYYSGEKKETAKFPSNKESFKSDEGRFRGGVSKKEESEFLRGFGFRVNWDFHYVLSLKNFSGGEFYSAYRMKNILVGVNFSQSGKVLDFSDAYLTNDLSDFILELKRIKENKSFGFVEYELPDSLKTSLKAGKNVEFGKYVFYKTKDCLYLPTQIDVGYEFVDFEIYLPLKKMVQIGGLITYRNYDRNDIPYLPKYLANANLKFYRKNFSIELRAHYSSNMQANEKGDKIPFQRRLDLIYYHTVFRQFDFRLEVRNLEDRELTYRENFYLPGRQILFGTRMNF